MKNIKLGLILASFTTFAACGTDATDDANNGDTVVVAPAAPTTDNAELGMNGTDGTTGSTQYGDNKDSKDQGEGAATSDVTNGVKNTGQYNSDRNVPEPPNTSRMNTPPAHTYGDTAPRRDGVNGVR